MTKATIILKKRNTEVLFGWNELCNKIKGLLLEPTLDNVWVLLLLRPGSISLSWLAPLRDAGPPAARLPLATAMRMIDRIHRHAAHMRPDPLPAHAARLAEALVLVLRVGDLSDAYHTLQPHQSLLLALQPKQSQSARLVTLQNARAGAR